ncbi:MAG: hypothetical protein RLZZ566_1891, partial [Pseudomonadota bacterium]
MVDFLKMLWIRLFPDRNQRGN